MSCRTVTSCTSSLMYKVKICGQGDSLSPVPNQRRIPPSSGKAPVPCGWGLSAYLLSPLLPDASFRLDFPTDGRPHESLLPRQKAMPAGHTPQTGAGTAKRDHRLARLPPCSYTGQRGRRATDRVQQSGKRSVKLWSHHKKRGEELSSSFFLAIYFHHHRTDGTDAGTCCTPGTCAGIWAGAGTCMGAAGADCAGETPSCCGATSSTPTMRTPHSPTLLEGT